MGVLYDEYVKSRHLQMVRTWSCEPQSATRRTPPRELTFYWPVTTAAGLDAQRWQPTKSIPPQPPQPPCRVQPPNPPPCTPPRMPHAPSVVLQRRAAKNAVHFCGSRIALLLLRSLRRATMLGTWGPRLRNQAEKMDILRLLSSFALMHREAVAADADATPQRSTTLTLWRVTLSF